MPHRDYEIKKTLTKDERKRILDAADSIHWPGYSPEWIGRLVRYFLFTGSHPATLYDPEPHNAHVEGSMLVLTRAKNGKEMRIPLPSGMETWAL